MDHFSSPVEASVFPSGIDALDEEGGVDVVVVEDMVFWIANVWMDEVNKDLRK